MSSVKVQNTEDTPANLLKIVQAVSAELHPHSAALQSISLDSSLDRDLGLDSLARVELLARIEQAFGISIPEQALMEAETPRDLLRTVLGASGTRAPRIVSEISRTTLDKAEAAPNSAATLVEVLEWHVLAHPDRPHIQLYKDEDEGEIITYRQLREGAVAVATGLQQRGLQPGARACIMLPTGREYFISFFGILLAGGVPVPIYPPVRPTQVEEHLRRHRTILNNCLVTILITLPQAKRFAQLLKSQVETMRNVVTVEELSLTSGDYQAPAWAPEDIAFLQYTSGSTGNPKGVVLTHANLLANLRAMGKAIRVEPTDVLISWLPLYHDMGLIGAWLGSLYYAALLVVMSPLAFLSRPQRWLWAMHRYRGTFSAAPNFGYELCLHQELKSRPLRS